MRNVSEIFKNYVGKFLLKNFQENWIRFREILLTFSRSISKNYGEFRDILRKFSKNILEKFENYFRKFWDLSPVQKIPKKKLASSKNNAVSFEKNIDIFQIYEYFEKFQKKLRKISRVITGEFRELFHKILISNIIWKNLERKISVDFEKSFEHFREFRKISISKNLSRMKFKNYFEKFRYLKNFW